MIIKKTITKIKAYLSNPSLIPLFKPFQDKYGTQI